MTLTDEVRSFNRFYTREIGLLNRRLAATIFPCRKRAFSTSWPMPPKAVERRRRSAASLRWTKRI